MLKQEALINNITIIGASPVCMLEAIYWANQQKNVTIIDPAGVGGSWKYSKRLGFEKVEIGPHVFYGPKNGYKVLRFLGVKLKKSTVRHYDIELKKSFNKLYQILKVFLLKNISIRERIKLSIKACKDFLGICNWKIAYAEGGCVDLINAIKSLPSWNKIKIIENKCIDIIHDKNKLSVNLCDGKMIVADKVIISSSCSLNFDSLYKNFFPTEKPVLFDKKPFSSAQISLLLENNTKKNNFTKFHYQKKRQIKFICDITDYVERTNKLIMTNQSVLSIAVEVENDHYQLKTSPKEGVRRILNNLKEMNLISAEVRLVDFAIDFIEATSLLEKSALSIEKHFNGKIVCLVSDCLLQSFSDNYKRWATAWR